MKAIKVMAGCLLIGTLASCDNAADGITLAETPKTSLYQVSPQEAALAVQSVLAETPVQSTRGVQFQTDKRQVDEVIDLAQVKNTRGGTALNSELARPKQDKP